jgi:hypothetical protein
MQPNGTIPQWGPREAIALNEDFSIVSPPQLSVMKRNDLET